MFVYEYHLFSDYYLIYINLIMIYFLLSPLTLV